MSYVRSYYPVAFVFSHIINITGLNQPFPVVRQRGPHIERKTPADTRSERYCTDCKPPQTALPDPFDADTRDTQSAPLRNFHVLYLYFMANHCRLDIRCRTAATGRFPMRMYLGNKHFRQGSRNTFTRHKF